MGLFYNTPDPTQSKSSEGAITQATK